MRTIEPSIPQLEPADTKTPDADLILQARRGDEAAWVQLMRLHQASVFRLAYLILGDAAEADDVAQDCFIRAYKKLDQFDGERPFRPWLLQICKNLARNRQRSLGRYWHMVQRFFQAHPDVHVVAAPLDIEADAQLLWQAVRKLRPAAQEIIYLRFFLEMSEAETAVSLDIAPGTVKSRTHRALKQLREVIEAEFPELKT
ncbi:MAG: RNA polymerase sigma factor [Anaerolineae bacterium]|nr:RNA polymerase sigma factor [Anaerolineae bacterium]